MRAAGRVLLLVASLLLAGCATSPPPETGNLPRSVGEGTGANATYGPPDEVTTLARDLDTVWEIAFSPDGRVFLTQRAGTIVVLDGESGPETWAQLEVAEVSESGLMGLALHPGFPKEPWVYACHTYRDDAHDLKNQIVRIREVDGTGGQVQVLLDGIDGSGIHDGCRLGFGPDGLLYATMGDAAHASNGQDRSSPNGKTLRMNATGAPAGALGPANPYVFTWGHRNPQGLAFHPGTGDAYITEHGPDDFDEVNVLSPGENYGWPRAQGEETDGGRFHPSIWDSGSRGTVAPAGAAFIDAPGSPLDGTLVFATLKASQLHALELDRADPTRVTQEHVLYENAFGRLRACVWGPDAALYLGTSNRDGRGDAGAQDDRVLRVPLQVLEDLVGSPGP